jgi:hypothetical protein
VKAGFQAARRADADLFGRDPVPGDPATDGGYPSRLSRYPTDKEIEGALRPGPAESSLEPEFSEQEKK